MSQLKLRLTLAIDGWLQSCVAFNVLYPQPPRYILFTVSRIGVLPRFLSSDEADFSGTLRLPLIVSYLEEDSSCIFWAPMT